MATIEIGKETWNRAVEVAPGFWVIATRHHPGGSKYNPEINNRCLVFRLKDASAGGTPVLLVANATDEAALPEVKRIEKESGAPIRYLIAAGAGHTLHLAAWHDALPNARVLVGPVPSHALRRARSWRARRASRCSTRTIPCPCSTVSSKR